MNTEETTLADKILKEAGEAPIILRRELISQYDRLIRASINRKEAETVQATNSPAVNSPEIKFTG